MKKSLATAKRVLSVEEAASILREKRNDIIISEAPLRPKGYQYFLIKALSPAKAGTYPDDFYDLPHGYETYISSYPKLERPEM